MKGDAFHMGRKVSYSKDDQIPICQMCRGTGMKDGVVCGNCKGSGRSKVKPTSNIIKPKTPQNPPLPKIKKENIKPSQVSETTTPPSTSAATHTNGDDGKQGSFTVATSTLAGQGEPVTNETSTTSSVPPTPQLSTPTTSQTQLPPSAATPNPGRGNKANHLAERVNETVRKPSTSQTVDNNRQLTTKKVKMNAPESETKAKLEQIRKEKERVAAKKRAESRKKWEKEVKTKRNKKWTADEVAQLQKDMEQKKKEKVKNARKKAREERKQWKQQTKRNKGPFS